jgi:hypothetical protein
LNIVPDCATKPLFMEKPFKELRFTRSHQAITFVIAGALFLCATAGLLLLWWQRLDSPPSVWWALLPMTAAWGCFRLAVHLTRHAYLLLSSIGIEIFPFLRPAQNMQLFSWAEIQHAEVSGDERFLVLTLAGYEDAKVIISLAPVKPAARPLLAKAVSGLMEKRAEAAAPPAPQ